MEKDIKKHYMLYGDSRMQSLRIILEGLDYSYDILSNKELNSIGFLDPSDTEFYLAVRFMAIQNYIRYTIQDFKEIYQLGNIKPHKYNSVMDKIPGYNFNMIQLINSCADYFKHKDEKISDHTHKVLEDFGLYDKEHQKYKDNLLGLASNYLKPIFNIEGTLNLLREWREKVIEILSEKYPIKDNPD